jgi:hypothetical protein
VLRGPARRLFALRIDPNRADAATLEVLPGIGPARAAAIVRARSVRPFSSVEELTRVDGIGPGILGRIRASVGFDPARAWSRRPGPGMRGVVEMEEQFD